MNAQEFAIAYRNPAFRIKHNMRVRLRKVFKHARACGERTLQWLGCSDAELVRWMESKWLDGMTWENYGCKKGQWVIDHIKPCAAFDLMSEQGRRDCFHYTNLQPLWHRDNLRKASVLDGVNYKPRKKYKKRAAKEFGSL